MGFYQEYKRLDDLCKEAYDADRGVSWYIDKMDKLAVGQKMVPGWKEDYKMLKHCRSLFEKLNKGAIEEEICNQEDKMYIRDFYDRIYRMRDPLAEFVKEMKKREGSSTKGIEDDYEDEEPAKKKKKKKREKSGGALDAILNIIIAILVIVLLGVLGYILFVYLGK